MTEALNEFARELMEFVRREAEAVRHSFHVQWSLPVAERVAAGRCVDGLEYLELKRERFLIFRCAAENSSDLREGDLVRLSRSGPTLPLLTGSLHRVEDAELWFEPEEPWRSVAHELSSGRWVLDRSYLDLESFYRTALKDLGETERGRERILPLFCGQVAPKIDLARFGEASEQTEKEGVNEAQSEAIAQAVATDLCHLVQGPPGTGKTFVLAHVVKQRVAGGERVLITAATHRAIHNALNMIRRIAPEITDIAKIGQSIYDPDLQVSQYETFAGSPLAQCEGGYVIGATPFATRSHRLRGVDFDAVIIDEAGQVTLPLAVMAMLVADTYVLVGDHRQLSPVIQSLPIRETHLASVFWHLHGHGCETMLDVTYRMNAELVRWPSECFYSGKLHPATANAGRRLALPQASQKLSEILDPAKPITFVEMDHCAARRYSNEEATLVTDLLVDLRRSGFSLAGVAVVVPFRRQARRIRTFLKARLAILQDDISACVIDTVDRLQGQEREVVIVSMTASEPSYVATLLDFLLQPQRLNVAVTRARSKLIILASEQLALSESMDPAAQELVELWKSLRGACHVIRL
jgi:DNA replication ATP-dependent helicase Dna2